MVRLAPSLEGTLPSPSPANVAPEAALVAGLMAPDEPAAPTTPAERTVAATHHDVSAETPPAPEPPPALAELAALGDEIAELSAHLNAVTYHLLERIAAFDRLFQEGGGGMGFRSTAHWLAWRTGLTAGVAREKVRVARALAELPRLSAAMERGALSYSKVRALTRVATPENEGRLLELAEHASAAQLERVLRAWRHEDRLDRLDRLDRPSARAPGGLERGRASDRPEPGSVHRREPGAADRPPAGATHRAVVPPAGEVAFIPIGDGGWEIRGRLDAEAGARLMEALECAGIAARIGAADRSSAPSEAADVSMVTLPDRRSASGPRRVSEALDVSAETSHDGPSADDDGIGEPRRSAAPGEVCVGERLRSAASGVVGVGERLRSAASGVVGVGEPRRGAAPGEVGVGESRRSAAPGEVGVGEPRDGAPRGKAGVGAEARVARRRRGPMRAAPPLPAVPADPVGALRLRHRELEVGIDAWTGGPRGGTGDPSSFDPALALSMVRWEGWV